MVPGKSYDIEIALPADHTRGTYWYHPHHHGSADVQVASGMAGAIIVEGDFADMPEIARARERVMLVIARKVHSGALPTSIRACRVGWLDGHSAQRYPATQFVDLAGGISPRHLEANAPPVGSASDIAETDNSDRR